MTLGETSPVNLCKEHYRLPAFSGSDFPFLDAVRSTTEERLRYHQISQSDITVSVRLRDTTDLTGNKARSGDNVFQISDRAMKQQPQIFSWKRISIRPLVKKWSVPQVWDQASSTKGDDPFEPQGSASSCSGRRKRLRACLCGHFVAYQKWEGYKCFFSHALPSLNHKLRQEGTWSSLFSIPRSPPPVCPKMTGNVGNGRQKAAIVGGVTGSLFVRGLSSKHETIEARPYAIFLIAGARLVTGREPSRTAGEGVCTTAWGRKMWYKPGVGIDLPNTHVIRTQNQYRNAPFRWKE
jgi:hypothetical protein